MLKVSPIHSISFCPVCGGGLCGIRVCGDRQGEPTDEPTVPMHGLVVCDECEAIWLEPDLSSDHQYPDADLAKCPVCLNHLWGPQARWAEQSEIEALGWADSINHDLDRHEESS